MSRNHTAGNVLHLEGETFTFDSAREAVTYLRRSVVEGVDSVLDVLLDQGPIMCECELDWNCPLHKDNLYTAQERINDRYASEQTEIDRQWGM